MTQSVSVYLRDKSYYVVVLHGSGGNEPSLEAGPVSVLPGDAPAAELGAAVIAALGKSTLTMAWPKDWKKVTEPLFTAANVKSWGPFAKKATNLRVDRDGASITVLPRTRDAKGSFYGVATRNQVLQSPEVAVLGETIARELRTS
jgi:hypothetical protein